MLPLFVEARQSVDVQIAELLEVIDSCRCGLQEKLTALSGLEELFSKAVLLEGDSVTSPSSSPSKQSAQSAWWAAQTSPSTCVALSLINFIHRIHQNLLQSSSRPSSSRSADKGGATCSLLIGCFTILQGLCLKHELSRRLCSRKTSLELLIDVISAKYWSTDMLASNAPAHAIDLLICISISSPQATDLLGTLQVEEVIRRVMAANTKPSEGGFQARRSTASVRRASKGDQRAGQDTLSTKCAEFLLVYECRKDEEQSTMSSIGSGTSTAALALRHAARPSERDADRKRPERVTRPRSSSPIKSRKTPAIGTSTSSLETLRREKVSIIRSRPLKMASEGHTPPPTDEEKPPSPHTPEFRLSPCKSAPTSMRVKAATTTTTPFLTPFANHASRSTPTMGGGAAPTSSSSSTSLRRGRSRERSPLTTLTQAPSPSKPASAEISSTISSPLKAIMGPSPAVQRAQARSVSPAKRSGLVAG